MNKLPANKSEFFCGMLLFSVFGLMVELSFTGLGSAWAGSFRGGVSLLMIPVYSFSYFLGIHVLAKFENTIIFKWYFRLPLIVLTVYVIEWIAGALYKSVGLTPWHYEHGWASDFSGGNITLLYAPAWLFFAVIVVPAIKIVSRLSPILLQLIRTEIHAK